MTKPQGTGTFFDMVQDVLNHTDKNEEKIITSGSNLTIETIAGFVGQIRQALAEAETVIVEFEQDVVLDITALQVFCSACQSAAAIGRNFNYRGPLPANLLSLAAATGAERFEHCPKSTNTSCFRKLGGSQ